LEKFKRGSELFKLAPTATESPQLPQSQCAFASEDLEWKAGPNLIRVSSSASKINMKIGTCS